MRLRDETASIGIGTMVVFVATALVAAVAAGILISAHSDVQKQEPDDEVEIVQVVGRRDAPNDRALRDLDVYVLVRADVDPAAMSVGLQAGNEQLTWQAAAHAAMLWAHHDADGSFEQGLLNDGDVVGIRIALDSAGVVLGSGDMVSLRVAHGATSVALDRHVGHFGDALVIPL